MTKRKLFRISAICSNRPSKSVLLVDSTGLLLYFFVYKGKFHVVFIGYLSFYSTGRDLDSVLQFPGDLEKFYTTVRCASTVLKFNCWTLLIVSVSKIDLRIYLCTKNQRFLVKKRYKTMKKLIFRKNLWKKNYFEPNTKNPQKQ